ncbi:DNA replication/repair protein RecF [Bifidobacterium vansinderenii]|uniref:DNA replication and repair protein RecF n=1 Tax=Bifidobacterium vansinderenii TaxID=1984871 RepID=A0A229VVV2_9BIFI|nr:DNA replication and repair protein RecF [Bifidobacterium vansinderenii]OXM99750.1 DNA recombination and repair protein RecF [Bifidobacterium vansinderenii]
MFVSRLALDDFRSWHQLVLDFAPGLNVLFGANGMGKTNIVEAIEVLSTGGSHRANGSVPLVKAGEKTAVIRANVNETAAEVTGVGAVSRAGASDAETGDSPTETVTYEVSIPVRGANRARINSGKSLYMRDVVGRVPSVTFSPEDQRLVSADPATRRAFLNQSASQLRLDYYETLQRFNQTAKQRSTLLRQLSQQQIAGRPVDAALSGLEIWTGQFIESGVALTRMRRQIVKQLSEPFSRIYRQLAGDRNRVRLIYAPSFEEVLSIPQALAQETDHVSTNVDSDLLGVADSGNAPAGSGVSPDLDMQVHAAISRHFQRIYPGEVAQGRNLIGPHRDDLIVELNGMTAREYASNGEMWTLALALRMAVFEMLSAERGTTPILILDDVFAQLDDSRRRQIVDFARKQSQVIITMAARGDLPDGLENGDGDAADGSGNDVNGAVNLIDVGELAERMEAMFAVPDISQFMTKTDTNGDGAAGVTSRETETGKGTDR